MAARGWHPGTATDVCSVWTWTSARLASSVRHHPPLFELEQEHWNNDLYSAVEAVGNPINQSNNFHLHSLG